MVKKTLNIFTRVDSSTIGQFSDTIDLIQSSAIMTGFQWHPL